MTHRPFHWRDDQKRALREKLYAEKYPHLARMSERQRTRYDSLRAEYGKARALKLMGINHNESR